MPILGITASQITGHLTPPDSGAMFPLGIVQLASSAANIEFTSIPATYKHLQLRFLTVAADGNTDGYIIFNSDVTATNYYSNRLFGNGNATGNTSANNNYCFNGWGTGETGLAVAGVVDILNYSDTNNRKMLKISTGFSNNIGAATNNWIGQHSVVWNNTNAITGVRILMAGGNLLTNSQATLYGIKGA
jgi:hypothetical protein